MRSINNVNRFRFEGRIFAAVLILFFGIISAGLSFSQEIRYQSGDRRDPFVPIDRTAPTASSVSGIQIEGILYDPKGKSMVVIQGQMYKEGDLIGKQKIVSIRSNKVVILAKGVETEYWISSTEQELAQKAGK